MYMTAHASMYQMVRVYKVVHFEWVALSLITLFELNFGFYLVQILK